MDKDIARLQVVAERFSKIGSEADLTPADPLQVVEETVNYMRPRISKNVKLSLESGEPQGELALSRPLFSWVLENLLRNAVDAMEGEGALCGSRGVGRGRGPRRGGRQRQRHDQIGGPSGLRARVHHQIQGLGPRACRSPNALWRTPMADRCSSTGPSPAKAPASNSCSEPRLNGPEARGRASRRGSKSRSEWPPTPTRRCTSHLARSGLRHPGRRRLRPTGCPGRWWTTPVAPSG